MSRLLTSLMIIPLALQMICISAQESVKISTPYLELQDDKVHISYEIINSTDQEEYRIWIQVTDSDDKELNARSLSGDIGEHVRGGGTRSIVWDYQEDRIALESGIYVQIFGEPEFQPQTDETVNETNEMQAERNINDRSAGMRMGGMLIRSAVFPGWGLSVQNPGSLHWVKGIAAYGCVASSLLLNVMARNNYDAYLESNDVDEFNAYYDRAVLQDNISEIAAYAALGIWVADLVWTVAAGSGTDSYALKGRSGGLQIGADINPFNLAPMIAIRYGF